MIMKELPADSFVENVVELLVSSGQPVSVHHANKVLKRTISKLPDGRPKRTAQSQLPQLKRLLKKKLQDVLPAAEAATKQVAKSIGSTRWFLSAVMARGSLADLLQARTPAHPVLLECILSQKEGKAFDESIIRLMSASLAPDTGHVINHACRRYSCELRQMSQLCIATQSEGGAGRGSSLEPTHQLCLVRTSSTEAHTGRLAEICKALATMASLVPLQLEPAAAMQGILRNACPPPAAPVATLVFTSAAAHVLAGWQQSQESRMTSVHFQQALAETERHVRKLIAGLPLDPARTDGFLLQHPVTEIDSCAPSYPWAIVPSLAWLAVHAAASLKRHLASPSLSSMAILLQRQCSLRHLCLGDTVAAEKSTALLAGKPCSAATCNWIAGLQQPARLVAEVSRQNASRPSKLGGFLLRYPQADDVSHLQRVLLRCGEEQAGVPDADQEDEDLFVLDSRADPFFTGAWSSPGASADDNDASGEDVAPNEGDPSDEVRTRACCVGHC
eukprot:jgi/Ulvmu1/4536/UM002_0262.1